MTDYEGVDMNSIPAENQCSFPKCKRKKKARQLCIAHLGQIYRGQPLSPIRDYSTPLKKASGCSYQGCGRAVLAKNYCIAHYQQSRSLGEDSLKPVRPRRKNNPGVWSDWAVNPYGYVNRWKTEEGKLVFQLQHRWVMEIHLGRELYPHENIHHKNGDRADNRLENLELWTKSQPPGQRVEDKINWAIEFLQENGYTVQKNITHPWEVNNGN